MIGLVWDPALVISLAVDPLQVTCALSITVTSSGPSSFGHLPNPRVGINTCFARFWKPAPHATEHGIHGVHSSRVQSRSHDMVLHASVSSAVLQEIPPFLGLVISDRVWDRTPPSQSAENFDQPDHSDITQSTGHFFWLHFFVRCRAGHLRPHSSGGSTTILR